MKNHLSQRISPYLSLMRLDKPIGSFLLLWPTLWALWIAAGGLPRFKILLVFCLGVVVMRSAGCVINDIADRRFDGKVKRTMERPLVTGAVSLPGAIILFSCLCCLGLILVLQLNLYTVMLSVGGLVLAVIYPFAKRFTYLPQVILGAAFAWSVPMAFAATNNEIPAIAWLLFLIAVIWPVAYDTIYALMDKEEDVKIGVKSTAILFGKQDTLIIFFLQLLVLGGLLLLGFVLKFKVYFFVSILIALILVCYQISLIHKRSFRHYYHAFYSNHWFGAVVFGGILLNFFVTAHP